MFRSEITIKVYQNQIRYWEKKIANLEDLKEAAKNVDIGEPLSQQIIDKLYLTGNDRGFNKHKTWEENITTIIHFDQMWIDRKKLSIKRLRIYSYDWVTNRTCIKN